MRVHRRRGRGPLAGLVRSVWLYEGAHAHTLERVLPSRALQLLVNLDEDALRAYRGEGWSEVTRVSGVGVVGLRGGPCAIDTAEQRRIAGVAFVPGGAWPFLGGVPLDELADREIDLEDLWGARARSLRDAMLEAATPDDVLGVLERALLERLDDARPDRAIAHAVTTLGAGARVDVTARELGMSAATLRRRFGARVGSSPKRFARVARLERALDGLRRGAPASWAGFALEHGFVDQSHLIRELRSLGDITPTEYVPRSPGEALHVVIDP